MIVKAKNVGDAPKTRLKKDLLMQIPIDHEPEDLLPLFVFFQEVHDRRPILVSVAKALGMELFQYKDASRGHCAILAPKWADPRNFRNHKIGSRTRVEKSVPGAADGWAAAKFAISLDVTNRAGKTVTGTTAHLQAGALDRNPKALALQIHQINELATYLPKAAPRGQTHIFEADCNGEADLPRFAPLRRVAVPYSAPSWPRDAALRGRGSAIDIWWLRYGDAVGPENEAGAGDHLWTTLLGIRHSSRALG